MGKLIILFLLIIFIIPAGSAIQNNTEYSDSQVQIQINPDKVNILSPQYIDIYVTNIDFDENINLYIKTNNKQLEIKDFTREDNS